MHRYMVTPKKNLTVHNCLERFLQVSICPLEVLIIIATPKRAVIHQLKSDMNRHTVIFGDDIPVFVYMIENSFSRKNISLVCTHGSACLSKTKVRSNQIAEMHPILLLLF